MVKICSGQHGKRFPRGPGIISCPSGHFLPQKHTLALSFKQDVGEGELCSFAMSECDSWPGELTLTDQMLHWSYLTDVGWHSHLAPDTYYMYSQHINCHHLTPTVVPCCSSLPRGPQRPGKQRRDHFTQYWLCLFSSGPFPGMWASPRSWGVVLQSRSCLSAWRLWEGLAGGFRSRLFFTAQCIHPESILNTWHFASTLCGHWKTKQFGSDRL